MRRANKLLFATIFVILLVGVVALLTPSPKKATEKFLKEVQVANFDKAGKYIEDGDWKEQFQSFEDNNEPSTIIIKDLFQKMEYTIKELKKDGRTAVVAVQISNVDMHIVMANVLQKVMEKVFTDAVEGKELAQTDIDKMITDDIHEHLTTLHTQRVIEDVDVQLVKQKGVWRVQMTKELISALSGGLSDIEKEETENVNPLQK